MPLRHAMLFVAAIAILWCCSPARAGDTSKQHHDEMKSTVAQLYALADRMREKP